MSSDLQELLDLLAEPEVVYLPPELELLPLSGTLTTEISTRRLQVWSESSNPVSKKLKLDSQPENQKSNKQSLAEAMELRDEEVQFVNSFLNPLCDTDPIFETHSEIALSSTINESTSFSEKESPSSAMTRPRNEKVFRLRGSETDRQFEIGTPRIERCWTLNDGRGRWGHLTTADSMRKHAILRRSRGLRIE